MELLAALVMILLNVCRYGAIIFTSFGEEYIDFQSSSISSKYSFIYFGISLFLYESTDNEWVSQTLTNLKLFWYCSFVILTEFWDEFGKVEHHWFII